MSSDQEPRRSKATRRPVFPRRVRVPRRLRSPGFGEGETDRGEKDKYPAKEEVEVGTKSASPPEK